MKHIPLLILVLFVAVFGLACSPQDQSTTALSKVYLADCYQFKLENSPPGCVEQLVDSYLVVVLSSGVIQEKQPALIGEKGEKTVFVGQEEEKLIFFVDGPVKSNKWTITTDKQIFIFNTK